MLNTSINALVRQAQTIPQVDENDNISFTDKCFPNNIELEILNARNKNIMPYFS